MQAPYGVSFKNAKKHQPLIINNNPAYPIETSSEGKNDTTSDWKDTITIVRAEHKVN